MPDMVEGQDIALAILEGARDSGWEAFRERYETRLIRQAEGRSEAESDVRSSCQAEDLVQGFLADRIMGRPRQMFGRSARGERPLWPRLSRSLRELLHSDPPATCQATGAN